MRGLFMLFENPKFNWLWEKGANVVLAVIYLVFVYKFSVDFAQTLRTSVLIAIVYETMLVYFLLTRATPIDVSKHPYDWFIAIVGTWIPLLMRPSIEINEFQLMQILQVVGLLISMAGLFSLSKSFGIVPANRGVKTDGIYKYIRHPLYSGYVISVFSFVVQNPSTYNIVLYLFLILFKVLRIQAEEEFLMKDKAYADYTKKTEWRLVPFIW